MAKKKQPDFQKTKLRVGKHLPKGRNVTNTSFKSKKIVTKDQKLKPSADDISLTDLIRLAHHTTVSVKTDALKKIGRYIQINDSSLPIYFSEILNATGKLLLESNPKVREEALNIIETCADILPELQMSFFMEVLTSHLSCMMTHIELSIKKDSLVLLRSLLKIHPNLICHSTDLLNKLLNMISSIRAQKGGSHQRKRKLDDNINTTITSVEWRDQVLKLVGELLQKLVDTYAEQKLPSEDEQKVLYDGSQPQFVQLYRGGGLTPAKLDFNVMKSKDKVTEELRTFFSEVVSVASDVVTEEIAGLKLSSNHNTLRSENVEHLTTVTQILCSIADWYGMDNRTEDIDFIAEMNVILRTKLMKGFCYQIHEPKKYGRKSLEVSPCAHLNLGISSLYCFFIQGTQFGNVVLEEEILLLVMDVLNRAQYQDVKTTSFVLKILKSFLGALVHSEGGERSDYNKKFTLIFDHLCEMAGRSKVRDMAKEIHAFFINLSLDYDYKFLLDSKILDSWTNYAFRQIKRMFNEKEPDGALLKCISLMCSREYESFMGHLNASDPCDILGYLKLNDEAYQLTVVNLITHMTNLPVSFLQSVARFILTEDQVELKVIEKFIRSLFYRFADQRVSEEEFKEFAKFLVNVCFDPVSVEKVMKKYDQSTFGESQAIEEEEEYPTDLINLLFYVQEPYHFTLVPSRQWARHPKIAEVCMECLVVHYDRELTMNVTTNFILELLRSPRALPIHSAMALLKLATRAYVFEDYTIPNKMAIRFQNELVCCGLLYISILRHKESPESCKALGTEELQRALALDTENAYTALRIIICKLYESERGVDDLFLLYALRIIKFLRVRSKISYQDIMEFHEFFSNIQNLSEDALVRATLNSIYEHP